MTPEVVFSFDSFVWNEDVEWIYGWSGIRSVLNTSLGDFHVCFSRHKIRQ